MHRTRRAATASVLLALLFAFLYQSSSRLAAAPSPSTALAHARAWLTGSIEPAREVPVLKKIAAGRVRLAQSATPTGSVEPWVTTDKRDYQPGETAQLTGGGFDGDTTIWLQVQHADPNAVDTDPEHHLPYPVQPNPDGTFSSIWYVEPSDSLGQEYVVTATGDPSGRIAEAHFTDAALASLDQCANDPAPSPNTDGCNSSATQWVNGNLGASKSVYKEGDSIPYRLTFTGLSTTGSHTVTIEWDTTKSGKHALDYITTFNRTVGNANPCLGVTGCSAATFTTFAIPADTQVTGAGVTPVAGVFTLYGGTITGVSAYSYADGTGFAGDKSARITITFSTTVANPVLAWGGHIATRQDWGASNSAVAISGSPYHTRLIDTDGTGGNQDRSLSADAVIFPGSITIVKDATPNGSTSFSFTGSPSPLTNFSLVDDGTSVNTKVFSNITTFTSYSVNETPIPSGWGFDSVSCSVTSPNGGSYTTSTTTVNITMKEGENWTCTYLDSVRSGTLKVIKHVVNDNGGTQTADKWSIHVKNGANEVTGSPQAGAESPGTSYTLNGGTYTVSETGAPSGYAFDGFSGDCDSGGSVTVVAGQTKTCTLTNNDTAPILHLRKVVNNDHGGTKKVADFTLTADGAGTNDLSGTSPVDSGSTLQADTWALSETSVTGYSASAWSCVGGTQNGSNITLGIGQEATCTITNNDQAGTLIVKKVVINNNGGTKIATDFTFQVNGGSATAFLQDTDTLHGKNTLTVNAGTYNVTEPAVTGYTTTYSYCSNITIANGETKTCTITNDDQAGTLIVKKVVINDNGGTKVATDFSFQVNGGSATVFLQDTDTLHGKNTLTVNAGTYSVTEPALYGYATSYDNCSSVAVTNGGTQTCTVTNNDQPGTIVVIKNAKPAQGSFTFTTTGTGYNGFILTGATTNNGNKNSQNLNPGTYTVKESTQLGWLLDGIGGSTDPTTPYNCVTTGSGGSTGVGNLATQTATITLKNGDTVTCTFENTGNGATRTQGFWATHPYLAALAWNGGTDSAGHNFPGVTSLIGDNQICGRAVDADLPNPAAPYNEVMGAFWSDISKTSTGAKRSALDQARMQLLQQLIAAELNAGAFGASPGPNVFTTWETALCGTDQKAIGGAQQQAGAFNSQGDSSTFTPGTSADSKYARAVANTIFWNIIKP